MSIHTIIMAAAGVSVIGGSWLATLDTASSEDAVSGIAVDVTGNVYVTGQANMSTATLGYIYLAKYNTNGTIQWQRSLDTASQPDSGNAIAVDSSGNVYVTGQANTTTNAYAFIAKYDTTGTIQWQRSINRLSTADFGNGITVDSSGNVYVVGAFGTTGYDAALIKYNSSGTILFCVEFAASSTSGNGVTVDSSGNIYLILATGLTTTASISVIKLDSAGLKLWGRKLDYTGSVFDYGYRIAVDSGGNVYVVGQANSLTLAFSFILKYDSSGTYAWQRRFDVTSQLDSGYDIVIDAFDNIYITGQAGGTTSTSTAFIAKYDTGGNIKWQLTFVVTNGAATQYGVSSKGIVVDALGYFYVTGNFRLSTGSFTGVFIAKFPTDGTIPLTGKYVISASSVVYTFDYIASTIPEGPASLVDAADTLVPSLRDKNAWYISGTAFYSIAVDSSNNVYIAGGNYVAKFNSDSTTAWQMTFTSATATTAASIAVDSTGNVYYSGAVAAAKLSSAGAIVWQQNGLGVGSIAVDSTGCSYVKNGKLLVKYDSTGTVIWYRTLGTAASGGDVAVDSSNNIYVITTELATTTAYCLFAKYNSSGVIQWQRSLNTASVFDAGNGIAVDGSGNVYVTGQANATTVANAYAFIAKYDTDGTYVWQRKIDDAATSALSDSGLEITVDSSGNIYVTGQGGGIATATSTYTFVVKYDTSGNVLLKRTLDVSATIDAGKSIAVGSDGYCYVLCNATTVIKLNTDMSVPAVYKYGTIIHTSGSFSTGTGALTSATSTALVNVKTLGTYATSGANYANSFNSLTIRNGVMVATGPTATTNLSYVYMMDTLGYLYKGIQAIFSPTATPAHPFAKIDADGNIYVSGTNGSLLKYNSSYVLQWQILASAALNVSGFDSSGNVYCLAGANNTNPSVIKFDSSGNVLWNKLITITGFSGLAYFTNGVNASVRSNGMFEYVITGTKTAGSLNSSLICNITADGSYATSTAYSPSSSAIPGALRIMSERDSTGSYWLAGQAGSGNGNAIIYKIDQINNPGYYVSSGQSTAVTIDSSDNVYWVYKTMSTTSSAIIIKLSSTGTWLFTRELKATTSVNITAIQVDNGCMYCVCATGKFIAVLPADGTLVTMTGYTYSDPNNTAPAADLTFSASVVTTSLGNGTVTITNPANPALSIATAVTNYLGSFAITSAATSWVAGSSTGGTLTKTEITDAAAALAETLPAGTTTMVSTTLPIG